MGLGVAEVHEEPVTEKLGDMPIVALNNFRTYLLLRTYHCSVIFGIELRRKFGGIDQVTEHHRELSTFCVRRCSRARCDLRGGLCLGSLRLCRLSRLRSNCLSACRVASPEES